MRVFAAVMNIIKPMAVSCGAQVPIYIGLPSPGATCPHFGLKRGSYYELIRQGRIKSIVVARPGCKRGRRLLLYESVAQCLQNLAKAQEAAK